MARNWLSDTAAVNDTAIGLLHPAPGERICEIGFGPGRTLSLLAAAGAEVVGIDVSPSMVRMAGRRNAGCRRTHALDHGDGATLPLADDCLDAAITVHNIYFWAEPSRTLADIARVLRPGGRLILLSARDAPPASKPMLDLGSCLETLLEPGHVALHLLASLRTNQEWHEQFADAVTLEVEVDRHA
jgi:ubiquinone/menaquinone biosynthesis C-methylase UbiE